MAMEVLRFLKPMGEGGRKDSPGRSYKNKTKEGIGGLFFGLISKYPYGF